MNALIIYDSVFGNTEQIAQAIGDTLSEFGEVRVVHVDKTNPLEIEGVDMLVLGCPTHRRKPTRAIRTFLESIPRETMHGLSSAAFDTRYQTPRWKSGSAARVIARKLKRTALLLPPESFFVIGREGPLEDSEIKRAVSWARLIFEKYEAHLSGVRS